VPQKVINASSSGDNKLLDLDTTSETGVFDYFLIAAGAVTAILKDEAGTEFGRYAFAAAGDIAIAGPVGAGAERFMAKGDLILNLSGAVAVTGHFAYAIKK
jgi:hypothetical protein